MERYWQLKISVIILWPMRDFLDLISTPRCGQCGFLGDPVCRRCLAQVQSFSRHDVLGLGEVHVAAEYQGWVRDTLIAFKSGERTAGFTLAYLLVQILNTNFTVPLVPIPSTPTKVRQRGFNVTTELCRCLARQLDRRFLSNECLVVRRDVLDQVGLSRKQRQKNLERAFVCTTTLRGPVIVLDDVVTTGATMSEAGRALRIAGAGPIFGLALCGTRS
ncbi:unannotated protein [freshwater metagenome]|uniref:Unannotated protein n=1 Tax=freshwater metagenome TaxID=449393 RepID=A0A6J5ZNJ2_9ZZZZ